MRPPGVLDLAPGVVLGTLPFALVALGLLGAGLFVFRSRRISRMAATRATVLDLAAGTWLALTLLVTIVPFGQSGSRPPIGFIPFLDAFDRIAGGFSTPSSEAADVVLNIVLFMPFGAWAAVRLGRPWMSAAIVVGAVLSTAIELSQAIEAAGRFASATDVVTNTSGAALGFLLGRQVRGRGDAATGEDPEP